jgi:tRNA pseudouridine13 synthase
MEDVLVPMVGKKTVFPSNELHQAIEKIMDEIGISVKMFKAVQDRDRALVINGDYRAMICHPKDFDYTIKEYYHPLQPLLQTDLMKLQGEDITVEPQQDGESAKLAMIVGFTLPSSAYATIALRELMKVPTSNEFQKEISLE